MALYSVKRYIAGVLHLMSTVNWWYGVIYGFDRRNCRQSLQEHISAAISLLCWIQPLIKVSSGIQISSPHPSLIPLLIPPPHPPSQACSAVITSATCFAATCAEVLCRNLHAPGLSRWFLGRVAFSQWASSGSAGSSTPQLSSHPAASPSFKILPFPSCSRAFCHSSSAHPPPGLWAVVFEAAGQARSGSTDPGPHEPVRPDFPRTCCFAYVVCGESGRWGCPLSLSLLTSEPLISWRCTVTYDFPPSVWISTQFTVLWRRCHLSTVIYQLVIYGAISDWRRMCTTLCSAIRQRQLQLITREGCAGVCIRTVS